MESLFKAKLETFLAICIVLFSIIFIAVWVRLETLNSRMVLDYDPWWFFRHAKNILENNFRLPKWDYLSYYPPGRPINIYAGWSYTIALLSKYFNLDLVYAAKISPLIMIALTGIVSYLLAYKITKDWIASLFAPIFILLSPAFLGVSVAGYNDTDAPVVFYFFLSLLCTIIAIEKRRIHFYVLAVLANLLFVFNWGGGWITLILFFLSIPSFVIFKLFEEYIKKGKINLEEISKTHLSNIVLPFFIIFISTNVIGYLLNFGNMFTSFFGGLAFTALFSYLIFIIIAVFTFLVTFFSIYSFSGYKISFIGATISSIFIIFLLLFSNVATKPLIVNISVAELQPLNISEILNIANRVGGISFFLTLALIPFAIVKLLKKKELNYIEIFLILWIFFMELLITRGVRFLLLFAIASSVASAYVISEILNYSRRNLFIFIITLSIFSFFAFQIISYSIAFRYASREMEISNNWYEMLDWLKNNADKDALIATWWDPGHIIAGYTGLKVHADGAHCGECYPYNHDIRIQDMGKIFSTSNENESFEIIKKYVNLTNEQCEIAKKKFPQMPDDACKPVSEVYLIASSDLIGKYYWMSCFATFDWKIWNESNGKRWKCDGRNFFTLPLTNIITKDGESISRDRLIRIGFDGNSLSALVILDNLIRYVEIKELKYTDFVSLTLKNNVTQVFILQQDERGRIKKHLVENVVVGTASYWFSESEERIARWTAFLDTSFSYVILADEKIRDSIFTKLFFFDGQGLEKFKLVLRNPEIRLYKVLL
ncbi:MAG: STT3 domain-containing protein [Candidatus Aenigmatarchaeota archaeon]